MLQLYPIVDLNLEDLSSEAADLIMTFPNDVDQYCECVRKLSKYICIQISIELDSDNANAEFVINEDYSSESECELFQ